MHLVTALWRSSWEASILGGPYRSYRKSVGCGWRPVWHALDNGTRNHNHDGEEQGDYEYEEDDVDLEEDDSKDADQGDENREQ